MGCLGGLVLVLMVDVIVIVRFVFVVALERVSGHAVDTHHLLVGVLRGHRFTRMHADAPSGSKREGGKDPRLRAKSHQK